MPCDDVIEALPGVVDGSSRLDRSQRRHVERCLRCQAELAQYRKLLRAMHALRSEIATPPPSLIGNILSHLEATGELTSRLGSTEIPQLLDRLELTFKANLDDERVAYLGGIAAATAAAGAGAAIVLATRGRKGRLPLAG